MTAVRRTSVCKRWEQEVRYGRAHGRYDSYRAPPDHHRGFYPGKDEGQVTRRQLLAAGGTAALAGACVPAVTGAADAGKDGFTFVHVTDMHIQLELGATEGVARAFAAVRAAKPAFALVGGDLVMDAAGVTHERADRVYGLWRGAAASLSLPLHYTVGNHDVYLTGGSEKLSPTDPHYGKSEWLRRVGLERSYNTFDHAGWRFITLDSLTVLPEGGWEGVIAPDQMAWVAELLQKTGREMPVVFLTHIPVLTLYGQYTGGTTAPLDKIMVVKNGKEFHELIQPYNVQAVLQGHTHVVEECRYAGVRYVTGGAVCGDWWKGKRLGVDPEGFTVLRASGQGRGARLTWEYTPYGWDAKAHQR